jgi:feruloyl esterase
MIMSQRYPRYFDGIVSGDPAIRTGHSNLGLAYFASALAGVTPALTDTDKKLIVDAVVAACDARDGRRR